MNRISFLFLCLVLLAFSQTDEFSPLPKGAFSMPVKGTIRLSGTFGELRPQHFHAGIDIKGYVGQPIMAAAEGYISRIKISPGGYGKVLYVSHPNGYTSVYAHLSEFSKEVEQYVKTAQYKQQKYAIDLRPEVNKFTCLKGEQIARMGITGRSYGPHVHFEIRQTATDKAINPLLLDLIVHDNRSPYLQGLKIIPIDDQGNTWPGVQYDVKRTKRGSHILSSIKDTIEVKHARTGVELQAFDQLNAAPNKNGIYELMLYQDSILMFHLRMDSLSLSKLRYLNAHLDYEHWWLSGDYFHRCFTLAGDKHQSIYLNNNGIIRLEEGQTSLIQIKVKDVAGNTSTLSFWLKRREEKIKLYTTQTHYLLAHDVANGINDEGLQLSFPKHTFYQDIYFQQSSTYEHSYNIYSLVHHLHQPSTPTHSYFEVAIKTIRTIPEHLKSKAYIAYCGNDQQLVNCGGVWKKEWLYTKARVLGDFHIAIDETSPSVEPINFRRNMQRDSEVAFSIDDNIATAANVKGLTYEGFIDGQWVLFTYDPKRNRITHQFEKGLSRGVHMLTLKVQDAVGNETIFEREFIR
jgi:murein DD-endopeptidase MepM/ murein hydrolase activator NlpD